MTDPARQRVLDALAALPEPRGMNGDFFRAAQELGWHLMPVHFAFPVPDTRRFGDDHYAVESELAGIDINEAGQLAWLEALTAYKAEYDAYPMESDDERRFRFAQIMFRSGDAEPLYAAVRHLKPARIIEIGSGMSTRLMSDAIGRNREEGVDCRYTVIDPYPDAAIRDGMIPNVSELIVAGVETIPLERFEALGAGDILFIDSSHMGKMGSDVNFEFCEVLPRMKPGVVAHVHDIFLPFEYPRAWVDDYCWFYNEQYYLQLFLAHNTGWEVLYAGSWLHHEHPDRLGEAFGAYDAAEVLPGSFWMRRLGVDSTQVAS